MRVNLRRAGGGCVYLFGRRKRVVDFGVCLRQVGSEFVFGHFPAFSWPPNSGQRGGTHDK